jgi:hypothetical protein
VPELDKLLTKHPSPLGEVYKKALLAEKNLDEALVEKAFMIQKVCDERPASLQEKSVSALLQNRSLTEKAVMKKLDDLARDRQRAQRNREKKQKEKEEAEAKAKQGQQQSKTTKKSGDGDKGAKRLRVSEKHRQMAIKSMYSYARRIQLRHQ